MKKKKIETYTDSRVIKAETGLELEKEIHKELYKMWIDGNKRDEQIAITIKNNTAVIVRCSDISTYLPFGFQESRIESILNALSTD